MSGLTPSRSWDAGSYHRVSGPMVEMAMRVLDRLPLAGDEHVMDAGCGTGRVTALLLDRLPQGRVVALDADPAMVAKAREELASFGDRVHVQHADLLQLDIADGVDAVFSTATFHWVLDHARLFGNLFRALRSGGRLVAQCGGRGNISGVLAAAEAVAAMPRWADKFVGWSRPTLYASPADSEQRLLAAGFVDVDCWLEANPIAPDDPREYLGTIAIGAHLQRLDDPADREWFLDELLSRLPAPVTVDYVRLNIDARRP